MLRHLGLRVVVLSNVQVRGTPEYWQDFIDLGVADLIDVVLTSLDVGYRKPHSAMFEAAIREAQAPATACVMVGDSEIKDIQPAVALAMRAIRVAIEQPSPATSAAHAIVTNLERAGTVIARWSAVKTASIRRSEPGLGKFSTLSVGASSAAAGYGPEREGDGLCRRREPCRRRRLWR